MAFIYFATQIDKCREKVFRLRQGYGGQGKKGDPYWE